MAIQFEKVVEQCVYLDPFNNFQPATLAAEKRIDPLTGDMSLLVPFKRFSLPPVDWSGTVADSLAKKCPFCPEHREEATPRFVPDFYPSGRMVYGGATVIPNLSPYEKYSAVVIISDTHYLSWAGLSPAVIRDAFWAGFSFLQKCAGYDPAGAKYCSINWNYMPYSGGTLVHPHLQVLAGARPTNYHRRCLDGALRYFDAHSSNYWCELISLEKECGERYIGATGSLHWVAAFAPKALADVTVVFAGCKSMLDVEKDHFASLADGLVEIFPFFVQNNIPSFNFSLFLTSEEKKGTLVTGRLVGRFPLIPPAGSDMSYLQVLHDTSWTVLKPEQLKEELFQILKGSDSF